MDISVPTIVVLAVLFALGWHNPPARNPEKKSPAREAPLQKQRKRI
jgi:hypothetical protein